MSDEHRIQTLEDAQAEINSLWINVQQLKRDYRDHTNRFQTLQTPWWKRVWFWIDGWPWYDLNGIQKRRPWHRNR